MQRARSNRRLDASARSEFRMVPLSALRAASTEALNVELSEHGELRPRQAALA
jgi:hypothetical protein